MEGSEISCRCDSPRREDKTQITHLEQGVDRLGFTTRGNPNGKLLTKLSNDALQRIRRRLSAEVRPRRGAKCRRAHRYAQLGHHRWAAY